MSETDDGLEAAAESSSPENNGGFSLEPSAHKCPECGYSVIPKEQIAPPIQERWREDGGIKCPKCDSISKMEEWSLVRADQIEDFRRQEIYEELRREVLEEVFVKGCEDCEHKQHDEMDGTAMCRNHESALATLERLLYDLDKDLVRERLRDQLTDGEA